MTHSYGLLLAVPLFGVLVLGLIGGVAPPAAAGGQTLQTRRVPVDGVGSYTDVNAAGLAVMLGKKDFPLVNVHIPYEGDIKGTDLFIPFDQVEAYLSKLPSDKGARVVLYCRSGRMSAIAARTLVKLGYRDIWNLDRGMIAWEQAGYPVMRKGQ
ncbi:MAG: rhodanese-like domain-containing protein [Candidatus Rokubacteria bacterium]|nr:rhodanese-like domain-containing protein [Candidatus Rokubacteria bacterium]